MMLTGPFYKPFSATQQAANIAAALVTTNPALANTTFASQIGIITKGGSPWAHDFNYGDNGSVTTDGGNTFIGGAGNLTMGATATQTYHASSNTANGYLALFSNTTGYYNTANGVQALYSNTTGYYNTANGYHALYSNTTGSYNTANGYRALYSNTTGFQNTANGYQAGRFIADGSTANATSGTSTYLGADTKANADGGANETVIGYNAIGGGSNTVTFGNSSVTTLRAQVTTITALSDARDKANIVPLNAGLDFINRLQPVRYDWNMRDGGKVGVEDTGFIAQDLKRAQEETNIHIPGLVFELNPDRLEAGYGKLLPVMVQAIKDLSAKVEQLERAV